MIKLYLSFLTISLALIFSQCKKETPPTYVVLQGEVPTVTQPPTGTQPPTSTPTVLSPAEILVATPGWWRKITTIYTGKKVESKFYLEADGFGMYCDDKDIPNSFITWQLTPNKDSIVLAGDKAGLRFVTRDSIEISSAKFNYYAAYGRLNLPIITSKPISKIIDVGENTPLAIDKDDNIYYFSGALRKRSKDGVITAIANPQLVNNNWFKAMFIDDLGRFYFQSQMDNQVARYDHLTKDIKIFNIDFGDSPGFYSGLTVDREGNIYYRYSKTDYGQSPANTVTFIKKIDKNGIITIVAGNGRPIASPDGTLASDLGMSPLNLAISAKGDIYYFEASNATIRKIDAVTHRVTTIGGNGRIGIAGDGGPAKLASIDYPTQIYLANNDDVYIQERYLIRKIDANTGILSTMAGLLNDNGKAISIGLSKHATTVVIRPYNMVVDTEGNIYFTNDYNYVGLPPRLCIHKVNAK